MLENGADIRFIQTFFGHSRLETTQIYTQVSIRQLKEIHTATHPAEQTRADAKTEPDADADECAAVADLAASLAAEAADEDADCNHGDDDRGCQNQP